MPSMQRQNERGGATMRMTLNGQTTDLDVDADKPLLWALRDDLGLVGTKYGCGQALCGACTVLIDGHPARACQTTIADVVQTTWTKLDVPQCGYCQSGQVVATIALLTANRKPTDSDIDDALSGNLCRCSTYHRIRAA